MLVLSYFAGLALNLALLGILFNNETTFTNVQIPQGEYVENRWGRSDVMSYVKPARNFLEHGVLGKQDIPDYIRTVGYPAFLALMMYIGGDNWHIWVVVAQAVIFAAVYPALLKIADVLFENQRKLLMAVWGFCILSGVYIATVPAILTDLFTAVFFTLGLCFGVLMIVNRSWIYLILHLFFIGYAAQVRPTLGIYPVINIFVLLSVARLKGIRNIKSMIIAATVALLILCNLPSLRNYTNHGFFAPSERLSFNLFNENAKDILVKNGRQEDFEEFNRQVRSQDTVGESLPPGQNDLPRGTGSSVCSAFARYCRGVPQSACCLRADGARPRSG